jgi:hypothetical protein
MWIIFSPVETTPRTAPHPVNAPMMAFEDEAFLAET